MIYIYIYIYINANDMLSQFPTYFVSWVPRVANGVVHALAKWSLKNNVYGSFDLACGPFCLVSVVKEEFISHSI